MKKKTSTPKILFRDRALLAVHKPSGYVIYADKGAGKSAPSLQAWVEQRLPAGTRAFPVHRLDKETCGVVLFALDSRAASLLQKSFREGRVEKTYWALAAGHLPARGRWTKPVRDSNGESRSALTEFSIRKSTAEEGGADDGEVTTIAIHLLELRPRTGRFHQIRQHAAMADAPLLGDVEYGGADEIVENAEDGRGRKLRIGRVALSAISIAFPHPVTRRRVEVRTQPDADFGSWIRAFFG